MPMIQLTLDVAITIVFKSRLWTKTSFVAGKVDKKVQQVHQSVQIFYFQFLYFSQSTQWLSTQVNYMAQFLYNNLHDMQITQKKM